MTIKQWRWLYDDDAGKRRQTRYHLSEKDALERYAGRNPEKVPHSEEEWPALGHTSDFSKR